MAKHDYLRAIRTAKFSFFHDEMPQMLTNSPRQFWQILNPQEARMIRVLNAQGEEVSDSKCADIFKAPFFSVFTNETSTPYLSHIF